MSENPVFSLHKNKIFVYTATLNGITTEKNSNHIRSMDLYCYSVLISQVLNKASSHWRQYKHRTEIVSSSIKWQSMLEQDIWEKKTVLGQGIYETKLLRRQDSGPCTEAVQ